VTDALLTATGKHDAADLIVRLCDERLAFLKRLKTWPVFGAGWARRVAEVRTVALAMARAAAAPLGRGETATDRGHAPINAAARKGVAGAIAAAGAAVAQWAHQAGARPIVVVGIVIAALGFATGGWFVWRWRQSRRHKASN
jgi:lysozyme family protein